MNKIKQNFLPIIFFCLPIFLSAQEFRVHDNGLIYSAHTMGQLERIVDSLNLRFAGCPLGHSFRSEWQTVVKYAHLDSLTEEAQKDLEDNIPFEAFLKKYPFAQSKECLAVQTAENERWVEDNPKQVFVFRLFPGEDEVQIPFDPEFHQKNWAGKILFSYFPKTEEREWASLSALFFDRNPETRELPELYARQLQYTECLIDTTMAISERPETFGEGEKIPRPAHERLFQKIGEIPAPDFKADSLRPWQLETLNHDWKTEQISKNPELKSLLSDAVDEAIHLSMEDEELEEWAGRFLSRKKQLYLMRLRRVYGMCSQDSRPRTHALEIAKLAAETASWELFLRAHLDIMNDRFPRMVDASYGWGQRQTYIRELEELGINVPMLLLGITFRVENPSKNHYFSSIGRTGRALAESRQLPEVEEKIKQYIAASDLDDFNRLLMYYLYRSVLFYKLANPQEGDQQERKAKVEALLAPSREALPFYMRTLLEKDEED